MQKTCEKPFYKTIRKKLKMPKTCEKPSCKIIRFVLCKKPLKKTPKIPEMRQL